MNREYNSRVSSTNSERLLKNLQNTTGDYFFCRTLYTLQLTNCRMTRISTQSGSVTLQAAKKFLACLIFFFLDNFIRQYSW